MMRRFGSVAFAALALGAICLPPAEAAYRPKLAGKMGGQSMKEVQKVVTTLKSMPNTFRWTFLAEKLGLMFMPDNAGIGHLEHGGFARGAHFIGCDGVEYDANAQTQEITEEMRSDWSYCAVNIERFGCEVIFSRLSSEVTEIVMQNANYHLQKMAELQPERRVMYLAYLAGLCYLAAGKSPYDQLTTLIAPHKQPIQLYDIGNKGCRFIDPEGKEQAFDRISRKYDSHGDSRWLILNVCVHHVGKKDILDLYPEDVKKMREYYKNKFSNLSLAKKLGVTYRPQTNADPSAQAVQKAASVVKSMQYPIRWTFFAEKMGLCFMPPNGGVGHVGNGSFAYGSHFIGGDGIEYDANSQTAHFSKEMWNEWAFCATNLERFGREAVFSKLPNDMAEFILQNAKYHLDKMAAEQPERRDMYLAYLAKLCYLPDGKSPYNGSLVKSWEWVPQQSIQLYAIENKGCKFIDTEGVEWSYDAVHKKYKFLNGTRWSILNLCAHHLGADAILALYPKEVKKLRLYDEQRRKGAYKPKTAPATVKRSQAQGPKPNTATAARLREWPQRAREAWIVERLQLAFSKDGSLPYDYRGWTRGEARYIGTDGKEHGWWQDFDILTQQDRNEWGRLGRIMSEKGEEKAVWIDLQEEVDLLKKMYMEHAPTFVW